ncbi:hypothetical protein NN561_013075 [Cricetulus griseus]
MCLGRLALLLFSGDLATSLIQPEDTTEEQRTRAPRLLVSRMCPSEMGTLWHLWSPVLISLAALFSKGEDVGATWAPGLNFAGSICVCEL